MVTIHKWERYDVGTKTTENIASDVSTFSFMVYQAMSKTVYYGDSYETCTKSTTLAQFYSIKPIPVYFKYEDVVYKYDSFRSASSSITLKGYKVTLTTNETQGSTSYGQVESEDADAYPENGKHTDGYWYVYIGSEETFTGGVFGKGNKGNHGKDYMRQG